MAPTKLTGEPAGPGWSKVPTLADVARLANVSISTAGRVLREADYPVHPSLRDRVTMAAARIGYVRNVLARTLRGGMSLAVGLVVGDMLDPYYGQIAEAITERAESAHSIVAIVCNMQRDPVLELKYCQQLWEHRVAGLILAGGGFDQWSHFGQLAALLQQMARAGIAVATLSPRGIDAARTFCVDNEKVGEMLARHLIDHGHRRMGVLLGPPQGEVTQQRLRGILRTLTGEGARFQVIHSAYTPQAGSEGVRRLLKNDRELTGFIAGSDSMAFGVCAELQHLGRPVPKSASVVSIGNTLMAQWATPRLTTVDVRLAYCGRAALDYVASRISGAEAPPERVFAPKLVQGHSVSTVLSTS